MTGPLLLHSRWADVELLTPLRAPGRRLGSVDALLLAVAECLHVPWAQLDQLPRRPRLKQVEREHLDDVALALGVTTGLLSGCRCAALYLPGTGVVLFPGWEPKAILAHELAHALDDLLALAPRGQWEARAQTVEDALWGTRWLADDAGPTS